MIRYWMRELAGWILVGTGLYFFLVCFSLLLHPRPGILEAPVICVFGIVVFRGGIHLLKVAVAARRRIETRLSRRVGPRRR